ncbi:MAG: gp53-like domain-containing protein [Plesiomonas sp.]
MAIDFTAKYPGRFDPVSALYPQGKFKNRSAPNTEDGSYMERDWLNDWNGFFGALLKNANVTPNGTVDTAAASQLYDALIGGIVKSAGLRDVGTGVNQIPDMSQFLSGGSGNNRWFKFPGGLMIQTMQFYASNVGQFSVNYPTSFPTTALSASITCVDNSSDITVSPTFKFNDRSGLILYNHAGGDNINSITVFGI